MHQHKNHVISNQKTSWRLQDLQISVMCYSFNNIWDDTVIFLQLIAIVFKSFRLETCFFVQGDA